MSNFNSNTFFSLINWGSHYFRLFSLWSAGQKDKKNQKKPKHQDYWHTLPKFAVGSSSVFQFAAYPLGLGGKGPSGFSKFISLTRDMHQDQHKWIYKTTIQVEGYSLLPTALSHYISSAAIWNLILTYLSLRKPFKCLKSRSCIKSPCECSAQVIY